MKGIWSKLGVCVILLLCMTAVDSKKKKRKKHKEPVDFTVVDDSTIQNAKTSSDGLPVDVNVNFDVLGSVVSLKLKRNPKVANAKDSVYVIRKSKGGVPVLVSQLVEETEVFGEYQDPQNNAIFTLSCPKNNTGNSSQPCDTTMEGTFRSGNEEYRMSVVEETPVGRVRRAATNSKEDKLWRRAKKLEDKLAKKATKKASKIYGIYKTDPLQATPTDFKEADPIIRGRVNAAFGHHTKIVRENALPGDRMYNVEVLVVIDYGLYERFYKVSQQGTEAAKDNEAKYNLKKYFSHVFNGVDMLYKSIDDPQFTISVAVSGFVIADSPDASVWSTPHIDQKPGARHELLVSIPLDELLRWSLSANNIPENDHIMLFTDYDLYSNDGGTKDVRTAGYARVSSVCSLDSVSVVEDHGGFQSINAAAHELGHSLGSRHDGRLNSCNPSDQFIMTAHGGFETDQNRLNPWRFSGCSVDYFKRYVNSLPPNNCLTDPVDIFDRAQFLHYVSEYPGQDYTPNEQCQDILGLDSYYGWGPELGMFNSICTEMSCKVPGSGRSYRIYKAATGTSCGDKMWCFEGQCKFDERAPTKDPQCVFGDTQRRFGANKSCREYMLDNPMRCYDSFYRTRCCDTCERLNTGVTACEYGDKFLNCRASGCWEQSYARDCCSTCGLAPHPVIRRPVDPPATQAPTRPPIPNPTTTTTTTTTRRTSDGSGTSTPGASVTETGTETTPSGQRETTAFRQRETTTFGQSETTTSGQTETTTTGQRETTTPGQRDTASGQSETTAFGQRQTTTSGQSETTTSGQSEITTSGQRDITTFGQSETTAFGRRQTTTSGQSETTITEKSETTTSGQTEITTSRQDPSQGGPSSDTSSPPVRRTTQRPNIITTRTPAWSGDPNLTPSGNSGLCIRQSSNFLIYLSCSKLPSIFGANACDNSLAARFCCEKCPAAGETSCTNKHECSVQYARECYIPRKKEPCCRTCKRFETTTQGCEYGDRIRNCQRYVSELGLSYVCSRYRTYCCGTCGAHSARTNSEPTSLRDSKHPGKTLPDISINTVADTAAVPNGAEIGGRIISAGGQRRLGKGRGLGRETVKGNSRGGKRGRGNNRKKGNKSVDTPVVNPTQTPSNTSPQTRQRERFIPMRTFVFRTGPSGGTRGPRGPRGPRRRGRGRGASRGRTPRGAIRQIPRVNFFLTSGKK